MAKSFKQFMKGGKWVKMQVGDSEIFTLNCDVMTLESKQSRFGDVIEVELIDSEGEEKIFNVKSAAVANQLSQFEEGDKIRISKVESADGKGRWKVSAAKKKARDEEEEDDELDEEDDDQPRKKSKKSRDEDDSEDADEDEEEDEEEEDEAPKKKKSKKVEEDDEDFDLDEEEEEEEKAPKKKKKKSKK